MQQSSRKNMHQPAEYDAIVTGGSARRLVALSFIREHGFEQAIRDGRSHHRADRLDVLLEPLVSGVLPGPRGRLLHCPAGEGEWPEALPTSDHHECLAPISGRDLTVEDRRTRYSPVRSSRSCRSRSSRTSNSPSARFRSNRRSAEASLLQA